MKTMGNKTEKRGKEETRRNKQSKEGKKRLLQMEVGISVVVHATRSHVGRAFF